MTTYICRATGKTFAVAPEEERLREKLAVAHGPHTFPLPPPSLCPEERKRRRLAFRNERNLYRRQCDLTGAPLVAAYSPDKPYKVYSHQAYFSDKWDARTYGRDFDFSRPLFEQVAELARDVPHLALVTSIDAEENNCLYINFAGNSRNCYLTFDSDFNEDSYYTNVLKHSKCCMDCSYVTHSELCFECQDCSDCYALLFSQDCVNCADSAFLNSCIGCTDCLFCCNLANKRYYYRNKAYSREAFHELKRGLNLSQHNAVEQLRTDFAAFSRSFPKRYCRIVQAENCTGDYIRNAKNCHYCFNIGDSEDLVHCDALYTAKDCLDVSSFGEKIERVYQSGTIGINTYNIWFSFECVTDCSDLLYCMECRRAHHSFASVGLRQNEYCILNKQFTKSEYFTQMARIVAHIKETGEWGYSFPIKDSWFGYNETMAQQYMPLAKEQCLEQGWPWSDYEPPPVNAQAVSAATLPDEREDALAFLNERAIICAQTGKPFRLIEPEIRFYRTLGLPLPARHPEARHSRRMSGRNPEQLWPRICAQTGVPLLSSYAPDRPEIVYSEEAYLQARA